MAGVYINASTRSGVLAAWAVAVIALGAGSLARGGESGDLSSFTMRQHQ